LWNKHEERESQGLKPLSSHVWEKMSTFSRRVQGVTWMSDFLCVHLGYWPWFSRCLSPLL
jgi:hypothetical protein